MKNIQNVAATQKKLLSGDDQRDRYEIENVCLRTIRSSYETRTSILKRIKSNEEQTDTRL